MRAAPEPRRGSACARWAALGPPGVPCVASSTHRQELLDFRGQNLVLLPAVVGRRVGPPLVVAVIVVLTQAPLSAI